MDSVTESCITEAQSYITTRHFPLTRADMDRPRPPSFVTGFVTMLVALDNPDFGGL